MPYNRYGSHWPSVRIPHHLSLGALRSTQAYLLSWQRESLQLHRCQTTLELGLPFSSPEYCHGSTAPAATMGPNSLALKATGVLLTPCEFSVGPSTIFSLNRRSSVGPGRLDRFHGILITREHGSTLSRPASRYPIVSYRRGPFP